MSDSFVEERFVGPIAILQFCRPAQRNALSRPTLQRLSDLLAKFDDNAPPAIILTGTDNAFLSGADISELAHLTSETASEFSEYGQKLTNKLANLSSVTIAAINGFCMGGGLDFALACNIRIASKSAVFAHPGARLGIITGWGGTQRLPRLIGRTRATELFTTARRFDANEALRMGLVTQVADPVLEAGIDLAKGIISTSSESERHLADNPSSFLQ